jgi:hypothetical protein
MESEEQQKLKLSLETETYVIFLNTAALNVG